MKNRQVFYLIFVLVAITGCAAPIPPEFVVAPEPPAEWKIFVQKTVGCPDTSGEYELIPKVAELQKDGVWRVSNGNWFDFLLLMPFDRGIADKWDPSEVSTVYSTTSLYFESEAEGHRLRIDSPYKNGEYFSTHIFSTVDNDFTCESGNLVFPEFYIHGGTEGASLSGRIYRQATITLAGDLLFYEQVQSHKSIHKYYLFKLKGIKGFPG